MQEKLVQSLAWEDSMEKEMATHSSILAWRTPWTEGPGGLQSWDCKESDVTKQLTHTHTHTHTHTYLLYNLLCQVLSFYMIY